MKETYILFIDGEPDNNGCFPVSKMKKLVMCKDCMHNGSFDTDCPIKWNKWDEDFCSYAERRIDGYD